jgi:hypothetical protein
MVMLMIMDGDNTDDGGDFGSTAANGGDGDEEYGGVYGN